MDTITLAVNLGGVLLLGLIVWWFWLSRPRARIATQSVDIEVANGVYTPAHISVPVGQPITLNFIRNDPSPCAEKVVFDELGITVDLPLGERTPVVVTPPAPGRYAFTCQMQMYRGELLAH